MFNKKKSVQSPFELFSTKVLLKLLENNGNKNVLVSPARIMSILAFLSNFTDDETKKHIIKILSITDGSNRYLTKESLLPSDNYESWASEEYKKAIRVENCSSLSRFSKSTFCTSAGSSKMFPSTTISGSAEPWMELT